MDEFFGAVERINDQEGRAGAVVGVGLLFGDQHHIGESGAQTGGDKRIGGFLGGGDGAVVGFGFDVEIIGVVNLHNLVARQKGKAAHFDGQLFVIQCHTPE